MPTYRDVTNFPPAPALAEDGFINLILPTAPAQKYVWANGAGGVWLPVQDDSEPLAGQTVKQVTQPFTYDFATQGGAVSNITLGGGTIPANALIVFAALRIITKPAAANETTATIAMTLESAGDIGVAATIDDLDAAGMTAGVSSGGASTFTGFGTLFTAQATAVQTTVARSVVLNITGSALNAGKFNLYLTYVVSA